MGIYPFGCHTWFKPDALADEWLSKITLEKTTYLGKLAYLIRGLPCWTYDFGEHSDKEKWPDSLMTQYNSKGCWYGICLAHSVIHTAILQERTKGGWTTIGGVSLKAVALRVTGENFAYHGCIELYIKDKGYFRLDVGPNPRMIIAPEEVWWIRLGSPHYMGNRHLCDTTGNYLKHYYLPYNPEWAGVAPTPPTPKKSYIGCTTTPSSASIWLKKH
jgi:hypothetical protein